MRIMIVTDLEGVAGVKNFDDWCRPEYSPYYGTACKFLTGEVNAAVDGFFAGGAEYVQVVDGHGPGGIDIELLDPRVEYARGWAPPTWPFGMDSSFDGLAHVGQHAKASTEYAHLCHTQNFSYIDLSVNGVSIGEFGQAALCAAELGIPAFFAAGDLAFTKEAAALAPGITACAVKRGVMPGTGEECTHEEYRLRNHGAVHVPPARAREMIREGAETAIRKLREAAPPLIKLRPPYSLHAVFRPEARGEPRSEARQGHADSFITLMGLPLAETRVEDGQQAGS